MRSTYIWAIGIAITLTAWLLTGSLMEEPAPFDPSLAERQDDALRVANDKVPTQVRVVRSQAEVRARFLTVRGKTENKRTVAVKTELVGRIVSRPIERGDSVRAGQLLCELAVDDRQAALVEATEMVNQATIEHQGALSLRDKGYNSDATIAASKARLASANANLSRRQLALAKTQIRAPFSGFIEDVHLEVGDFAQVGMRCATLIDMDPMLIVGRVSEQKVQEITAGTPSTAILSDGRQVNGPLSFIGQQGDSNTRTYAIELQVPNATGDLRSGLTTEIYIPVEKVLAQKISPALFALNDSGGYGVRVVDNNNIVNFYTVDLVAEEADGVWVTGLPNTSNIITVGQELVVAGERVDPIFSQDNSRTVEISQSSGPSTVSPAPGA